MKELFPEGIIFELDLQSKGWKGVWQANHIEKILQAEGTKHAMW